MTNKSDFLTIGEVSKLTGASHYSLRYYERINILKPALIDSETGYRYYTFDQINHISIIMYCIEFDIPLKEFPAFTDSGDMMDFRTFLGRGREIAEKKLKALRRGIKMIEEIERQMDLADSHKVGDIYTREIPKKYFYCKPCSGIFHGAALMPIIESFSDIPFLKDSNDYISELEFGFLCEYMPSGTAYHAFIEVPKRMTGKNVRTIPAGTYFCRQSEGSQIEQTSDIFKEHLTNKESYLAIETDIFTGKLKLSGPLNELRVIAL